tara:strand:- start:257 stop:667 length:411 start_codon:yes stop_codon:yes gene_type:complete
MKKVFFTIVLACATLIGSAQFTVVSSMTSPSEGESWGISNFTNNIGIGYSLNDKTMIGAVRNGDNYDVFARYNTGFGFLCVESPADGMSDNMDMGYGMYIKVYDNLSVNPMYMIPMNADENGNREGGFSIGVSYSL